VRLKEMVRGLGKQKAAQQGTKRPLAVCSNDDDEVAWHTCAVWL